MDLIFKALTEPARRTLLDNLRARDGQTLTDLCAAMEMTRFGVMKHLKVLEAADLVLTRKEGRFKYHYLNAAPLQEALDRWVEPFRVKPAARSILDLKSQLEGTPTMSKPDFISGIYVRCTAEALWNALRDPAQMMAYDFMGQTAMRDGDTIRYTMPDGTLTLVCREIEVEPMTRLVTTFEPTWDAKPSRVVYLIEDHETHCRLTVEHHDLTWPAEYGSGTADGWARTLAGLKTWLESGEPAHFDGGVDFAEA
jgi:DNA-binding transcriptional ArsR family regulator/uncharacterized protein YndB with AHSA1/START domain